VAIAGLLPLAAACGGAGGPAGPRAAGPSAEQAVEDAVVVRVEPVVRAPMSAIYGTSTTLRADRRATVSARTRGVLRRTLVEEGDWVTEGAPIAVLEDEEQRIEAERTATAHDTTLREHDRARHLHGQGLVSDEEYERVRRAAEDTRHAADLAALQLSRTVIQAPFSGRIVTRHVDPGATVADGTPVYEIADLDPLYADVPVPEREVRRLEPGQVVRLFSDSDRFVTGRIERIAPVVDPETGTVKVSLAVPAADGLLPGSFVRVEIVTETHAAALTIPRSALVAEGRRWHVFRLAANRENVERVEVVRGFEEGDRVEIVETLGDSALDAEDLVVVAGATALTDGAAVRVVDDTPAEDEAARVAA